MDKAKASGSRTHFRIIVTSTPKLLVHSGDRWEIQFINESGITLYIGDSGTVSTLGFAIPTLRSHQDRYSNQEWWGYVSSGSGTISGYVVY